MNYFIKHYRVILLTGIILLAAALRFYNLSKVPVSLYWDETAAGYNAYSILKTGRDEYGKFMPLLFQSFDDYKTPVHIYLTAISIGLFGLNEFAVRFPSAFLGTLSVLVTFFLVKELLSLDPSTTKKTKHYQANFVDKNFSADIIALLVSFFLAISPWHIEFSRAEFEANVGLFFILCGAFLFLKGLKKYNHLLFSLVCFVVSMYCYRSIIIFVPLLLTGFTILYFKELKRYGMRKLLFGILLCIVFVLPLAISLSSKGGLSRSDVVSISTQVDQTMSSRKIQTGFVNKIFNNRRVILAETFFENYFSHFSPTFLFLTGDPNPRHSPRGMGVLYIWELPFLLLGAYLLFTFSKKTFLFTMIWIFLAPIPAALSFPSPHALRTLNILPMPQLLTSFGVVFFYYFIQKNVRMVYLVTMVVLISYFFIRYVQLYNLSATKLSVSDWADGYKQLTQYVFAHEKNYDKVLISGHYWQPYIYFLFYKNYDPVQFQKNHNKLHFGKYVFGGTSWDKDETGFELGDKDLKKYAGGTHILAALSPDEYSEQKQNIEKLADIRDHNGTIVFIIGNVK